MLSTLSSTRFSSTRRDTGEATASGEGDAGASPSFLGVLSAPPLDPLRERNRRKDLRMLSFNDFLLERCSPLSVSWTKKSSNCKLIFKLVGDSHCHIMIIGYDTLPQYCWVIITILVFRIKQNLQPTTKEDYKRAAKITKWQYGIKLNLNWAYHPVTHNF